MYSNLFVGFLLAAAASGAGEQPAAGPQSAQTLPVAMIPPPPPRPANLKRTATPMGNPATWVTASDYPPDALRERRTGVVAFRVDVGADGRVMGCEIVQSSGWPDLDATTCQLLTARAMFRPALDLKGKPVRDSYRSRVRWVMPSNSEDEPASIGFQLQPKSQVLIYYVEPDGTPSNCMLVKEGVQVTDSEAKTPCSFGVKMKPYLDADGKPVRTKVVVNNSITIDPAPK